MHTAVQHKLSICTARRWDIFSQNAPDTSGDFYVSFRLRGLRDVEGPSRALRAASGVRATLDTLDIYVYVLYIPR